MSSTEFRAISMAKYARVLPRLFPNARTFEIRDPADALLWRLGEPTLDATAYQWTDLAPGISRSRTADGQLRYRRDLTTRDDGLFAQFIVAFDTTQGMPLGASPHHVAKTLGAIGVFLQEEFQLQQECDQLAVELSERYEELNLVYATKDHVEFFEEGQEALNQLVSNCADYLDVNLAALILRDKGLIIHHANPIAVPERMDELLTVLSETTYDLVESRIESVVVNRADETLRRRILGERRDNVLAYPVVDASGSVIGILATVIGTEIRDFTNSDRNLMEVMAKKASKIILTHHDSLTGLMNRSGFEYFLISTLSGARNKNLHHCVLHLNIDQLHVVNDLIGHDVGDDLIRDVARNIKGLLRDSDFVARLGGDQFGVLLSNCSLEQGGQVATKILDGIEAITVTAGGRQLQVTASVGVAPLNKTSNGIISVLAAAEIACKSAKDAGRNRVELFAEENSSLVKRSEEIEWMSRLQDALRADEFLLYCQPVKPLESVGNSEHFEILLRLRDETGEALSPGVFMPAAERYQMMPMLDRWVLHNTLVTLSGAWEKISAGNPVFCINLSGQSLTNNGFLKYVVDEIANSSIPPANLCFEITETAAISKFDDATQFIAALRRLGCKFALDDFGAGLSSFGYLKALPVDYLKIDGSFVKEITEDPVSLSMVTAIAQVGKTMGLKTIAEFVQDDAAVALLREIGVDYVQGYGIRKPVTIDTIVEELRNAASAETA